MLIPKTTETIPSVNTDSPSVMGQPRVHQGVPASSSWWAAAKGWSTKGFFAILDQGLISGSNFLIAILLARELAPRQYGAFALAFEIFLLLMVVNGALILEPLSIFGSSVFRDHLNQYVGQLLRSYGAVALMVAVAAAVCAWIIHGVTPGSGLPSAVIGVAVSAPSIFLFWLARRVFYVQLSPQQAVKGAGIYSVALLSMMLVIHRFGLLTPFTAFLLMGASAAAATPAMLARIKPRFSSAAGGPSVREVVKRHWVYGRWALLSAVMVWLSTAIFYPMLASFHSLADAGEMKALMNFSSPIGQAFAAFSLLSLPYAARVHHQSKGEGNRSLAWRLVALYGGGTLLYWLVIIALRGPIITHLYAGRYRNLVGLLPWLALGSVLRISATAHAVTLRAMHSPSLVFVAYSAASISAVVMGIPFMWFYGLRGAVMTLVLSSGVALVVAWAMVHRSPRTVARVEQA